MVFILTFTPTGLRYREAGEALAVIVINAQQAPRVIVRVKGRYPRHGSASVAQVTARYSSIPDEVTTILEKTTPRGLFQPGRRL
jgi:hypothetical protein